MLRAWSLSRAPGAPRLPLVLFCRELLALLEAGLGLVEALEKTLCEKEARPSRPPTSSASSSGEQLTVNALAPLVLQVAP